MQMMPSKFTLGLFALVRHGVICGMPPVDDQMAKMASWHLYDWERRVYGGSTTQAAGTAVMCTCSEPTHSPAIPCLPYEQPGRNSRILSISIVAIKSIQNIQSSQQSAVHSPPRQIHGNLTIHFNCGVASSLSRRATLYLTNL